MSSLSNIGSADAFLAQLGTEDVTMAKTDNSEAEARAAEKIAASVAGAAAGPALASSPVATHAPTITSMSSALP
jgi:hypothetical protein